MTLVPRPSPSPSSLNDTALALRLADLTGEERQVLVDFLLHLDEFDRRRAFLAAGYDSLWTWCLGALHLREGPAARRIGAMRMLRRFPSLEEPLRDGRLCLSTLRVLGPVMTEANVGELIERATFRTKAEVEELVVDLQPRAARRDGVRRVAGSAQAPLVRRAQAPLVGSAQAPSVAPAGTAAAPPALRDERPASCAEASGAHAPPALALDDAATARSGPAPAPDEPPQRRVDIEPVARDRWSMRVTLDADMKADLDLLASLASHAHGRDLAAVLHDAIRCGIDKHGKRKGAVEPSRALASRAAGDDSAGQRIAIPAEVRRQVWRRDGGRCTWTVDGRRCGSRYRLEFDHVVAVARGGASTVDNVRLLCCPHNALHAEQTFGREHVARCRGAQLALT
jgi:hypothetical protein